MTTAIASRPAGDEMTLMKAILAGERFWPMEPASLKDTGLSEYFLDSLILRTLGVSGNLSGRAVATALCVPFPIVEPLLDRLRSQQLIAYRGCGTLNDYIYTLTEEGRRQALVRQGESAYLGPAPVPLSDYLISVHAQGIADEPIRRDDLLDAFYDVSVDPSVLKLLGPAINSASGLFLYGSPGNGKSTLAHRITACFGQQIWLPHAIIEGQEIIRLFDPTYHVVIKEDERDCPAPADYDGRWLRVRRPTVVVGGELGIEDLEIRFEPGTNVHEAPLQMKSNCGCLLIDDFGRQRIPPEQLLNRWIIPLENRYDYLTLRTGKKIQVPFEQLIIFSTNLDPADLVDEAFLRRIRYRIEIGDPSEEEFHTLFRIEADSLGCTYDAEAVDHLLQQYYRPQNRPRRRCHARDLMQQVRNYCIYNELPFEMRPDYFDEIAPGFFTEVRVKPSRSAGAHEIP